MNFINDPTRRFALNCSYLIRGCLQELYHTFHTFAGNAYFQKYEYLTYSSTLGKQLAETQPDLTRRLKELGDLETAKERQAQERKEGEGEQQLLLDRTKTVSTRPRRSQRPAD